MDITILPRHEDCGTLQMIGQFWDPNEIKTFGEKVNTMLYAGIKKIVIDLSRMSFISSQGIGAMVVLFKTLSVQDILVVFYKPEGCVKELIEISGLAMVMKIAFTEEELAAELRK
jgi:anti-anti-sigma factor